MRRRLTSILPVALVALAAIPVLMPVGAVVCVDHNGSIAIEGPHQTLVHAHGGEHAAHVGCCANHSHPHPHDKSTTTLHTHHAECDDVSGLAELWRPSAPDRVDALQAYPLGVAIHLNTFDPGTSLPPVRHLSGSPPRTLVQTEALRSVVLRL